LLPKPDPPYPFLNKRWSCPILQDEVLHEEDLQNLKEDLVLMVTRRSK
jgi:hypothetical protein